MPWWSWIVIWVALAIAALLYLGALGYWLFRRFLAATDDLQVAMDRLSVAPSAAVGDGTADTVDTTTERDLGIFTDPIEARRHYDATRQARRDARRRRRMARKVERGQPQSLRDLRA